VRRNSLTITPPVLIPVTGETNGATTGSGKGTKWPTPRFVVGRGATENCVTDKLTGLMWPKNGRLFGSKTWIEALNAVKSMNITSSATGYNLCGYTDWRLPNVTELKSLTNYGVYSSAYWLIGMGFVVSGEHYWSSTSYALDTNKAWAVNFDTNYFTLFTKSQIQTLNTYFWPVRGGLRRP
jgi:hypothetical protein